MRWFKKTIERFKNFFVYEKDVLENTYYEETMNEYGSKKDTKDQVKRYVEKLKTRKNNDSKK